MIPSGILDLTRSFLNIIWTDEYPSLGPEQRTEARKGKELLPIVDQFCRTNNLNDELSQLLRSAALLWHDDLTGSHAISQRIHTADGSFLHGIMHRREPDNSNAKYWFRQTGNHPCYPALAATLKQLNGSNTDESANGSENGIPFADRLTKLISFDEWNAFAFVDACHNALKKPTDSFDYLGLKTVQGVEFFILMDYLFQNR